MNTNKTNPFLIAVYTTIVALIVTCSLVFIFSMFDKTTFLLRMKDPVELTFLIVCPLFAGVCSFFWTKNPILVVRTWTVSRKHCGEYIRASPLFYCLNNMVLQSLNFAKLRRARSNAEFNTFVCRIPGSHHRPLTWRIPSLRSGTASIRPTNRSPYKMGSV